MQAEKYTFLVIDDDPGDVEILRRHLEDIPNWNSELLAVDSTEECCRELPRRLLDVIFLDYMLGAETGLDVLKKIRGMGDQRPVIVLTGQGDEVIAAALTRAGADDYLVKNDITPDGLRRSITSVMEQNKLRQEKALLAEQLQQSQKMEAIGALAGGLAHDFNNMLTAMMGYLELAILKSEGREVEKDLLYVETACRQMAELVQRLLSFSRGQSSELKALNLRQVLKESELVLKHTMPKSIDVEMDIADEPLMINGNPAMIQQVMLNLCLNASDAMPQGGWLRISAQPFFVDSRFALAHPEMSKGNYIKLEVQDEGTGIEKNVIGRIFEPFFTTKRLGQEKGTGLGLAVVWQNIKDHGGYVNVYSEPGRGTSFKVYFPQLQKPDQPQKQDLGPTGLPKGSENILVVDDEELVRKIAAEMLQRLGYTIFTASDGVMALETYNEMHQEINGILMDISMPRMGGKECLTHIKKTNPEARVLFASGHDMSAEHDGLMKLGACGIIQKPFRLADLAHRIRDMLDH